MIFEFRIPTKSDVENFLAWKYEGIYSFYDNNVDKNKIEWIEGFLVSSNDFSVYNEYNELVGNCSYYYIDKFFCIGVQMRPNITGKGFGTEFVKSVVDFGKQKYNYNYIDLTVAKFNKRAIKVYERLGFKVIEEFVNTIRGIDYEFQAMRLEFDTTEPVE